MFSFGFSLPTLDVFLETSSVVVVWFQQNASEHICIVLVVVCQGTTRGLSAIAHLLFVSPFCAGSTHSLRTVAKLAANSHWVVLENESLLRLWSVLGWGRRRLSGPLCHLAREGTSAAPRTLLQRRRIGAPTEIWRWTESFKKWKSSVTKQRTSRQSSGVVGVEKDLRHSDITKPPRSISMPEAWH
jgi:hypothetical protein